MQRIVIIIILTFWFLSLTLLIFDFIDSFIFIPSKEYKYFAYIYSALASSFLIQQFKAKAKKDLMLKNPFVMLFVFIGFFHLYLVGLFSGVPHLLQYFPSAIVNIEKQVLDKHYKQGRSGNFCYYQIKIAHSFYYGRICTTKNILDIVKVEDKIQLRGKKNIFGFFSKTSDLEEDLRHNKTLERNI